MWISCLAAIIFGLLSHWTAGAALDCSLRWDPNSYRCCALPTVNFEPYRPFCGRFMPHNQAFVRACMMECVFNASQVFIGSQLSEENAAKMLRTLFGPNPDFVNIFTEGLAQCAANVDQLEGYWTRSSLGGLKCSRAPVSLGICAAEYAFQHCPTASWRGTRDCEETRRLNNRNCSAAGNRGTVQ